MDIVAPQRQLTTGAGPGVPALRIEQADAVTRNGSAQAAGPQRPLFMAVADDAWGFREPVEFIDGRAQMSGRPFMQGGREGIAGRTDRTQGKALCRGALFDSFMQQGQIVG